MKIGYEGVNSIITGQGQAKGTGNENDNGQPMDSVVTKKFWR